MQTSTLVILLTGIIAMLVALVGFLCWRMARKNDELRHKNRVIVQEIERNQTPHRPCRQSRSQPRRPAVA